MRRVILLIVAILIAAGIVFGGAVLISPYLKAVDQAPAPAAPAPEVAKPAAVPPERRVVIFTTPKAPGEFIDAASDLTVASFPAADIPADAFASMDVLSDAVARNRLDGWEVLLPGQPGDPVTQSMLRQVEENPEPVKPDVHPNETDVAFLDRLVTDPTIVLFSEEQLTAIRLRSDVVVDISVESPLASIGDGSWVGRETIVRGVTLRVTSLDVTGYGAKPVFYAKLSPKEADKVRAAQAIANGRLRVEPHRGARAIPPIGHVCVGNTCFEALPDEQSLNGFLAPRAGHPGSSEAGLTQP